MIPATHFNTTNSSHSFHAPLPIVKLNEMNLMYTSGQK